MDIKILVATHKQYWMPDDKIYFPIQVGAEGKKPIGYKRDNEGTNISCKNKNYCELTGLYWAWKNLDYEYIGLVQYRRHFTGKNARGTKQEKVISGQMIEEYLKKTDIILPKPRKYYIETNYSQYVHAHHAADLDITREIISEKYPKYLNAYDNSMKRTIGHRFNMFIMNRDKADKYCEWLFDILFILENRLDISQYSDYDSRVFGFVSERLLDVWIETNKYDYMELPFIFMEKQNWIIKGGNFVKRKIKGMKGHTDGYSC